MFVNVHHDFQLTKLMASWKKSSNPVAQESCNKKKLNGTVEIVPKSSYPPHPTPPFLLIMTVNLAANEETCEHQ